ncbi:hypothetical protein LTR56_020308 [Elasticomyces elasticus]|nr:hypothetical protein LTR56_020308 [Elasticomyces elasticus]KAK3655636.1 hypothetical protein LTR22_010226 [Elasticomyces elasticus]KAK4910294.1 hypothetical protein LTR49_021040 [Elasticomyces elasticus]KAK5748532.1 hypothetical protein LTS12_021434 [Elasticomyces elasticus]
MVMPYQYKPLEPTKKQFRLINILKSSTEAALKCSLEVFSLLDLNPEYKTFLTTNGLTEATSSQQLSEWISTSQIPTFPPYEIKNRFLWGDFAALSYVWGDPRETTTIEVNSVQTQITKSLAAALHCLRETCRFAGSYHLWVDALAINQLDDLERSQQVAVMRDYYTMAWSVIGFLGPAQDECHKALGLVRSLADIAGSEDTCEDLRTTIVRTKKHPHMPGSWLALNRLALRPYWIRLWIMQELALGGPRAILYYGSEAILWHTFCRGLGVLSGFLWIARVEATKYDCRLLPDEARPRGAQYVLDHIFKDIWMLSHIEENQSQSPKLSRLMEMATSTLCSDPRDKVYGMLGVMDREVAKAIEPDYTRSAAEACTRVAEACIVAHKSVEILRDANLWGPSGAPTWVPDFTWTGRRRDSRPDDTGQPDDASPRSNKAWLERRSYRADSGLEFTPPVRSGRKLLCTAVLFDAIDGLGLGTTLEPDENQNTLVQTQGPLTQQEAERQFARLGWVFFEEELVWYERWTDWYGGNAKLRIGGWELERFFSGSVPHGADEEEYKSAYTGWVRTSQAGIRRLFTTAAGRLGWVSCARGIKPGEGVEAQRGDVLAVFPGCSTPILLRPHHTGDHYLVFGEIYVEGMMDGELRVLLAGNMASLQQVCLE